MVFSLLLIMALAVLSAGTLTLAAHEARIAALVRSAGEMRGRAEDAVRLTMAGWSTRELADVETGREVERRTAADVRVGIRRLAGDVWLVTGRAGPDARAARAGALVRTLDVAALRDSAAVAAAAAGRVVIHGGVASGRDACDASLEVPAVRAPELVAPGDVIEGVLLSADPPTLPDGVPWSDLADARLEGGAGTPRPRIEGGACAPGPWGWGSTHPGHPCARPHVIHSARSLTVRGGEGVGLLVVDGDLTLGAGVLFHGVIAVSGRLVLDGGEVRGSVLAADMELRDGTVRFDACRVRAAFDAPAFDRALRPAGRWWVPLF